MQLHSHCCISSGEAPTEPTQTDGLEERMLGKCPPKIWEPYQECEGFFFKEVRFPAYWAVLRCTYIVTTCLLLT